MWVDTERLRKDLDRAENEIEALEARRDEMQAQYAALEANDPDYEHTTELAALDRRIEAIEADLRWLYREVEDIEDVLPPERAWTPGVL